MEDNAGNWTWAVQDAQGSVRGEVDNTLAVLGIQHPDPYGNLFGQQGSIGMPFAYTGEMRDPIGLQYHRARYYDPAMGGWLSLDPFEGTTQYPMSLNGYMYVEGQVVNAVDPSGLLAQNIPQLVVSPQRLVTVLNSGACDVYSNPLGCQERSSRDGQPCTSCGSQSQCISFSSDSSIAADECINCCLCASDIDRYSPGEMLSCTETCFLRSGHIPYNPVGEAVNTICHIVDGHGSEVAVATGSASFYSDALGWKVSGLVLTRIVGPIVSGATALCQLNRQDSTGALVTILFEASVQALPPLAYVNVGGNIVLLVVESQMTPELQALANAEFREVIWHERIVEFIKRLIVGSDDPYCLIRTSDGVCIERLIP